MFERLARRHLIGPEGEPANQAEATEQALQDIIDLYRGHFLDDLAIKDAPEFEGRFFESRFETRIGAKKSGGGQALQSPWERANHTWQPALF